MTGSETMIKAKKEIRNNVVALLYWASKLYCKSYMQNAKTLNKEYGNQQEVFCHYQTTTVRQGSTFILYDTIFY